MLDERRSGAERTFERVDPGSLARTRAVDAGAGPRQPARGDRAARGRPRALEWPESLDDAGRLAAYVFDGDLFLLRLADSRFERLTRTEAEEALPRLSPDGKRVVFVRDHDLWLLRPLRAGPRRASPTNGSDTVLNGRLSWLYWEEIFGRAEGGIRWSPDSTAIAFLRSDESPGRRLDLRRLRAGDPAPVIEQRYPTVGTANPLVRARHLRPRLAAARRGSTPRPSPTSTWPRSRGSTTARRSAS